jgi:hypothetical protein
MQKANETNTTRRRTASLRKTSPAAPPEHDIDFEGKVFALCRAVKVVSSVIADQLQYADTPLETSDYGLETASYRIDADMVRYAIDHAAELALEVDRMMVAPN